MDTNIYVFEGLWSKRVEAPQVLPYLQAYEHTYRMARIHHRTFRNADDLSYYLKMIPAAERAFVYIACHADENNLYPSKESSIGFKALTQALASAKQDAVAFLHFGCCRFVDASWRRKRLEGLLDSVRGAVWVSGYTTNVPWLESMLLDLAFMAHVFAPWHTGQITGGEHLVSPQRYYKSLMLVNSKLGITGDQTKALFRNHLIRDFPYYYVPETSFTIYARRLKRYWHTRLRESKFLVTALETSYDRVARILGS